MQHLMNAVLAQLSGHTVFWHKALCKYRFPEHHRLAVIHGLFNAVNPRLRTADKELVGNRLVIPAAACCLAVDPKVRYFNFAGEYPLAALFADGKQPGLIARRVLCMAGDLGVCVHWDFKAGFSILHRCLCTLAANAVGKGFAAAGRIGYRYGYLDSLVIEIAKAEPVDKFFNGLIAYVLKAGFADFRRFCINIEHFLNIVLIPFLRFVSGRILRVDAQDVLAFFKPFSQLSFTVKHHWLTIEGEGMGHRGFSCRFHFWNQAHARFSVLIPVHVFVHISVGLVHLDGRKGWRFTILFDGFIGAFLLVTSHVRHTDCNEVLLSGCSCRLRLAVDAILLNFKDVFISPCFGGSPGLAAVQRVFPRGDVAFTHCHIGLKPYGFFTAPAFWIYRLTGGFSNISCQLLAVVQLKAVAAFCGIARVVGGFHCQRVHAVLGDVYLNIFTVLSFMLRRHDRLLGFVI